MGSRSVAEFARPTIAAVVATASVAAIHLFSVPAAAAPLLLAIAVGAGVLAPAGALGAALFALPWFFHPIGVGSQQFPASELLLLAATGGFGLSTMWRVATSHERTSLARQMIAAVVASRLIWLIGVLVVVGLSLALRPYDPEHGAESLREWRWTLLEPLVLLVLLALIPFMPRTGERDIRRFLAAAFIVGGVVAAGNAFLDAVAGTGVQVGGVTRIAGPYPHPNALALYLTRLAAFSIAWLVFDQRLRRALFGPALLVAGAAIVTFSRGALLALATSVTLTLPALPRRIRAVAVAAGAVMGAGLLVVGRDRMLDLFDGGSGSLRLNIWRSAIRMIEDRPLTGYGPDQFLYAYLPRYIAPSAWNERFTAHAHNLLFDFWIRLGIIGGAFALLAMVILALRTYHLIRGRTSYDALAAAATVGLVAVGVHGLVDNAYSSHDLAMGAWLLAWLAFGPGSIHREEGMTRARPRDWRRRLHRLSPLR